MTALWWTESGPTDAPVVLLLHGGGMGAWMWRDQVAVLRERYRVIRPDLPGHDHSAEVPFGSPGEIVADLAGLLREVTPGPARTLGAGAPETTVVGFSFGAQLALALAAAHPDLVARAVVVSALTQPMPPPGLGASLGASVSAGLVRAAAPLGGQRWFAHLQARALYVDEAMFDDYLRTARSLSATNLVAMTSANAAFRIPEAWEAFPGQALLLAGGAEPRALVRGMRELQSRLPPSELEVVPGAGHGLPLQHAAWFTRRLSDWLNQQN
ncbi:alpha/beta fold hydrolase [Promicromonospora kroppenstedtii]|uniref:Alpha/beta fold hydrolase n=1 Tax=Promicromonospora kroppenstedtii TaxID=440482 RepID=A0ABW7XGJ5_9MICO